MPPALSAGDDALEVDLGSVPVRLPDAALDALVVLVGERLGAGAGALGAPAWMDGRQAAAYLGVSLEKVKRDPELPRHRWGGRVLYARAELDDFLRAR